MSTQHDVQDLLSAEEMIHEDLHQDLMGTDIADIGGFGMFRNNSMLAEDLSGGLFDF